MHSVLLVYRFSSRRPPGPPPGAPLVDSHVGREAAQHHLQVKPLALQLDALLGQVAGLPAQLALHLPHPPHVVVGHIAAGLGAQVPPAGWREGHLGLGLWNKGRCHFLQSRVRGFSVQPQTVWLLITILRLVAAQLYSYVPLQRKGGCFTFALVIPESKT